MNAINEAAATDVQVIDDEDIEILHEDAASMVFRVRESGIIYCALKHGVQ